MIILTFLYCVAETYFYICNNQRWALPIEFRYSNRTKEQLSEFWTNIYRTSTIGLARLDLNCCNRCPYFSWWLCRMRHMALSDYGFQSVIFFCYRTIGKSNIEYRIGEFKKLSDYQISDQGLNLSDYRILDSEKTIS